MNNKGFTLIELLAVIVILVGISLTAVIGISSSLDRRENKECEEQIELAKNAAKIYFSLLDRDSTITSVSILELKDNEYLSGEKVDRLLDSDIIYKDGRFTGECQAK